MSGDSYILEGVTCTNPGQILGKEVRHHAIINEKKLEFQERQDLPTAREQGENPACHPPL